MSNIKEVSERSKAVVDATNEVEMIQHNIQVLEGSDKFSATLEYSTSGNRRFTKRTYLSRDELTGILNTRLALAKDKLKVATEKYEELKLQ